MTKFADDKGVVGALLSREITVRKLNELEAELKGARSAVAETEQRIRVLEQERAGTATRLTTSVRTAGNPFLEQQIAQTRQALTNAEENPVREETTDRDATHEMLKSELAKARADLHALLAKVAATSDIVDSYRGQARKLNETEIAQQDLARKAKTAEENYLLYSHKQEEARISDALDRQRLVNVSVAQPPSAPPSPVRPRWLLNLAAGLFLAFCASVALALIVDRLDRSFRTPDEVEMYLSVPIFAAIPANCEAGE